MRALVLWVLQCTAGRVARLANHPAAGRATQPTLQLPLLSLTTPILSSRDVGRRELIDAALRQGPLFPPVDPWNLQPGALGHRVPNGLPGSRENLARRPPSVENAELLSYRSHMAPVAPRTFRRRDLSPRVAEPRAPCTLGRAISLPFGKL